MKFIHMSSKKIKRFKTPPKLGFIFKPHGCLWFSCGNQWETYAKEDLPEGTYESYKYKYEAELDESKLIILKTYKDIKEFSDKFLIPEKELETLKGTDLLVEGLYMDWDKVREETGKDGIYVKNAQIKRARFDFPWYSTFDICSVAVWGKDAIKSMTLI